jgi:hypothetical protein
MKKLLIILAFVFSFLAIKTPVMAYVRVNGYYRSNGTYVNSYVRSNPNGLRYDNYGYTGGSLYNNSYYSGYRYNSSWYTPSYYTDSNYYTGKNLYNSYNYRY